MFFHGLHRLSSSRGILGIVGTGTVFVNHIVSTSQCDSSSYLYRKRNESKPALDSIENISDGSVPMRKRMETMIFRVQNEICKAIEEIDGNKFREDKWTRSGNGGGGWSRVIQNGNVFEKAGVNVSVVHGSLPPQAVAQMKARGKNMDDQKELPFYACGISLVIHPHNPMAPTIHLNYRYFEVETGNLKEDGTPKTLAWFGGGADLTPSYVFEDDALHFHNVYKDVLDQYDTSLYPKMKTDCDKYFYLPHRQEARGIGGIFFDDQEDDLEKWFKIVTSCAGSMIDSYIPIISKRKDLPFTEEQKQWQQLRRGRYVEFNLIHDRGTKFGLATPGSRIESILMSLPLTARWEYMHEPEANSKEGKTLHILKNPVDWMGVNNPSLAHLSTGAILEELAQRSQQYLDTQQKQPQP